MGKLSPGRHAPEEVDAYLDALDEEFRRALERVRTIIRDLVPEATERVSYRIPIFRLGKDLVGISAHAKHCALHTMSPPLVKELEHELRGLEVSGATLHFTPEAPLPDELIGLIVRRRAEEIGAGEDTG